MKASNRNGLATASVGTLARLLDLMRLASVRITYLGTGPKQLPELIVSGKALAAGFCIATGG